MPPTKHILRRILDAVSAAPPALLAYALFAIMVTLADFVVLPFAPASFRTSLVQYTGWGASGPYAFTIFFAFQLMLQRQRRGFVRFFGITVLLLIMITLGNFDLSEIDQPNYNNPYLTISPWRRVWTIFIPVIWIMLLHTPGMNRFCRETPEPNAT